MAQPTLQNGRSEGLPNTARGIPQEGMEREATLGGHEEREARGAGQGEGERRVGGLGEATLGGHGDATVDGGVEGDDVRAPECGGAMSAFFQDVNTAHAALLARRARILHLVAWIPPLLLAGLSLIILQVSLRKRSTVELVQR